jgi:hypothetical protein
VNEPTEETEGKQQEAAEEITEEEWIAAGQACCGIDPEE